ncbi:MAG TPA: hypothetical protein VFE50_00710 [Cyclobacteriaceae bacterium]|nr:hypothetical protein [Cyclobacteriaceae bacterium]
MEPYNKNQEVKKLENQENKTTTDTWGRGRMWAGLVVIAVGVIWIAREAGADIPRWITSPPMILVAVGLFIGARSSFRNWVWLIPFGIGVVLVADRAFYFDFNIKPFIWPAIIVTIGLVMILRRNKKDGQWGEWGRDWNKNWNDSNMTGSGTNAATDSTYTPPTGEQDMIDSVNVFGSTKKNILSKNFRGGEVVSFFGGCELNLSQADIHGPVMLEMTQVFGGAKLIVPSNWRIQSELVSVFGGVDDKRMIQPNIDPNKVLVLRGTNVFGGLEIKSF